MATKVKAEPTFVNFQWESVALPDNAQIMKQVRTRINNGFSQIRTELLQTAKDVDSKYSVLEKEIYVIDCHTGMAQSES